MGVKGSGGAGLLACLHPVETALILPWLKQFSSHVNCVDHTASHPWKDEMEPVGSRIPQSLRAPGRDKRLRNVLLGTMNGRLMLWSSAISATIYSLGDLN